MARSACSIMAWYLLISLLACGNVFGVTVTPSQTKSVAVNVTEDKVRISYRFKGPIDHFSLEAIPFAILKSSWHIDTSGLELSDARTVGSPTHDQFDHLDLDVLPDAVQLDRQN